MHDRQRAAVGAEEVEQVLAVNLDPLQRLPVNRSRPCARTERAADSGSDGCDRNGVLPPPPHRQPGEATA